MRSARFLLAAVLCVVLTSSLMLLKGCGNQDIAPDGSTVTINPTEVDYAAPDGILVEEFFVTVKDENGRPLNGVTVTISGGFAFPFEPTLYWLCRKPGGVEPTSSPFTGTTDNNGIYRFSIVIGAYFTDQLTTPVMAIPTVNPSGILAAGTYQYRVSAVDGVGETPGAQPVAITLTALASGVNVNWVPVLGATGYNVYVSFGGNDYLVGSTISGAVTTFHDDGTAWVAATIPTQNTTSAIRTLTSFTTQLRASSGTAFDSIEIKFNAT